MTRIIILCCIFMGYASPVWASATVGIAAVVDDQAISSLDLNDRMTLVMGMTNITDTAENRTRLAPQVLHQLIDEKLQMQDGARASITITDAKLLQGIAQIEKQSNKPPGSLGLYLADKKLPKASFDAQIRAQMVWTEIVARTIRPRIRVSDQEVARYVQRKAARSDTSEEEVLISTLQLPVDAPSSEASVRKLADKLAGEIRAGASFDAVAAQFAPGTGDTKAAAPFWIGKAQLDASVAAAIAKTVKDGITDPVRTASGYQIIKLMDMRQAQNPAATAIEEPRAELAFRQVLMTLKATAPQKEAELLLKISQDVAKSPGTCNDKAVMGVDNLADLDFQVTFARNLSSDLPEKLRRLLMALKVGGVSEPVVTPQGIRLFMLCERMDMPPTKVETTAAEDAARRAIFSEKLELEAQKYLRNLRREAFIEIR